MRLAFLLAALTLLISAGAQGQTAVPPGGDPALACRQNPDGRDTRSADIDGVLSFSPGADSDADSGSMAFRHETQAGSAVHGTLARTN